MRPRVSVVIPTRNRRSLLLITLRSVLWQQDVELEVIIVDDASTDDTQDAIAHVGDARVSVLRNATPQGPGAARNRGATEASGDWLAFVDDDDVWGPSKLARQIAAAERASRDWAYAGVVTIGAQGEIVAAGRVPEVDDVLAALPRYNPIPGGGSNVIVRRDRLREAGGFDERCSPCEDWELWLRLARLGPPALIDRPLVGYRVHGGNASLDLEKVERAARLVERLHGAPVDWGRMHRWLAEVCLRNGRRRAALGQFARAAVRGHARGVAADLQDIMHRRLRRLVGGRWRDTHADPPGLADATAWLRELNRAGTAGVDHSG